MYFICCFHEVNKEGPQNSDWCILPHWYRMSKFYMHKKLDYWFQHAYIFQKDWIRATQFYEATLGLQSSFEPAKERLRSIQCERILRRGNKSKRSSNGWNQTDRGLIITELSHWLIIKFKDLGMSVNSKLGLYVLCMNTVDIDMPNSVIMYGNFKQNKWHLLWYFMLVLGILLYMAMLCLTDWHHLRLIYL